MLPIFIVISKTSQFRAEGLQGNRIKDGVKITHELMKTLDLDRL